MKKQFDAIPEPLQKQIRIRGILGILFFFFAIILFCYNPHIYSLLPPLGVSAFSVISAVLLYNRAVSGCYIVIEGVVKDAVLTPIRKQAKIIVMQTYDEKLVRIQLKQRRRSLTAGMPMNLYVADTAPVYEKDGYLLIYEYLAMDLNQSNRKQTIDTKSTPVDPEPEKGVD